MEADDDLAFTEKTSGTFLSGLSDCSNLTFSKVQRYWESNSAPHKEVNKDFEQSVCFCYIHNHTRIICYDTLTRSNWCLQGFRSDTC